MFSTKRIRQKVSQIVEPKTNELYEKYLSQCIKNENKERNQSNMKQNSIFIEKFCFKQSFVILKYFHRRKQSLLFLNYIFFHVTSKL